MTNKQSREHHRKIWLEKHPDYFKKWLEKNRESRAKYGKDWIKNNPDKVKEYRKRQNDRHYYKGYFQKLRLEVLSHYCGGQSPRCACCGEDKYEFMAIDHMNNDGAKHRKENKIRGNTYRWLKKNNYPDGFQILCHNCNMAKGFYGMCPHKHKR